MLRWINNHLNSFIKDQTKRWLPRVITNIVLIERELENETLSISLKVLPRKDLPVWILLKQGLCFGCQFLH